MGRIDWRVRSLVMRPLSVLAIALLVSDAESTGYDHYNNLRNSEGAISIDKRVWSVETTNPLADGSSNETTLVELRHLATFLGLTDGGGAPSIPQQDQALVALLAAHHFNERIAGVAPQIDTVDERCPSLRFTVEVFDTEQDPMVASRHLVDDILKRGHRVADEPYPTAIIGADRSVVTEPLVPVATVNDLPLFSHSATSTSFDASDLFGRVVPSLKGDTAAAMDYLSTRLKVKHLGILYVRDNYGLSYMQALVNAASSYEIETTISSLGLPHEEEGDRPAKLSLALKKLQETEFRYIFGVFSEDEYTAVMSEAHRQNMTGPFGYVWLYGDLMGNLPRKNLTVPAGSDLASIVAGNAFVAAAPPLVQLGEDVNSKVDWDSEGDGAFASEWNGEVAFQSYWNDMWQNPEWIGYAKSKIRVAVLEREKSRLQGDGHQEDVPFSAFVPLMYDAVIAVALAACELEGKPPRMHSGRALYRQFARTSMDGASGKVIIDRETGSRNRTTLPYAISNTVVKRSNESGVVAFELRQTDVYLSSEWKNITNFVFPNGTEIPPADLPAVKLSVVETSTGANIFGLVLCGLQLLLSLSFGIWTAVNRKTRVVKASQPFFLGLVCLGAFIMASAIIPMSIEEFLDSNDRGKDIACMATPWLFSVGFAVAFSALLSKMMRVNKIFNAKSHQRVKVTPRDVMKPFFILLGLTLAFLVSWTIVAPLTYQYVPVTYDRYARLVEVRGVCTDSRDDWATIFFPASVLSVNAIALIFANVEAYRARNVSVEFSESRYIAISMVVMLQGFLIGIPIMVATQADPTPSHMVHLILLLCTSCGVLLPIFVPKLVYFRKWKAQEAEKAEKKRLRLEKKKEFEARIREDQYDAIPAVMAGNAGDTTFSRFNERIDNEEEEFGLKISYPDTDVTTDQLEENTSAH